MAQATLSATAHATMLVRGRSAVKGTVRTTSQLPLFPKLDHANVLFPQIPAATANTAVTGLTPIAASMYAFPKHPRLLLNSH